MRVSLRTMERRIVILAMTMLLLFSAMVVRLVYVQVFQQQWLHDKAEQLWQRNIPFEPERGKIVDRNGQLIVGNESAPSLYVVPRHLRNPADVARKLSNILAVDSSYVLKKITRRTALVRLHPEGRKLTKTQMKRLKQLALPGVYFSDDYKRFYPKGSMLAHIVGFTGIDSQGLTGLEQRYNHVLTGVAGAWHYEADAQGNKRKNGQEQLTAARRGQHLQLTIDANIQAVVERELNRAMVQYEPEAAMALVIEPHTGEVLAMSTRPTFHPIHYKTTAPHVYNRNLPIWSAYEPGSTFKIVTLAASLNEKKVDLHNDDFYDKGVVQIAGARLRCWKRSGHGHESFLQVVENSCNPGFIELGQRLGTKTLFRYIRQFGFGEKTGIDLAGESEGILFKESNVGPVELATTSFGQGVSVTPIQQVMALSATINGGRLMKPYVVKRIVDGERVVAEQKPIVRRQVITEETSRQVRAALESVVARGTGRTAYVEGFRVGGKTGTAQKAVNGRYLKDNYIVSFLGFAPADHPKIVVYVAVDHPKKTVQFGGVVAGPIVGTIMEEALPLLKVAERTRFIPKMQQWPELPLQTVPSFLGKGKAVVMANKEKWQVVFVGRGRRVIAQAPKPGVRVPEGATIRLYLGE